jgi:hypothetical protein
MHFVQGMQYTELQTLNCTTTALQWLTTLTTLNLQQWYMTVISASNRYDNNNTGSDLVRNNVIQMRQNTEHSTSY